MFFAQADIVDRIKDNWIFVAVGLGVLVALIVVLKIATSRKKPHLDIEKSQLSAGAQNRPGMGASKPAILRRG
jgi:hypothetical protein